VRKQTIIIAAVCLTAVGAYGATFSINSSGGQDTVYFRSEARLEFIEGKTNNLDGSFQFDPSNLSAAIQGTLRVDLRTLKTGIDMRDEHMRERHLQTDQFPFAYFQLTGVKGLPQEFKGDTTYQAVAEGFFYIHGIKRKIEALLEITRRGENESSDALAVRAKFPMNLDAFKIPRPKALFLKLAETVDVEVYYQASASQPAGAPIQLPDWPEIP
jgi:polyisoprenoid-binding protein YceI